MVPTALENPWIICASSGKEGGALGVVVVLGGGGAASYCVHVQQTCVRHAYQ